MGCSLMLILMTNIVLNKPGKEGCLVLASHKYDAADYIRDYGAFQEFKNTAATSR